MALKLYNTLTRQKAEFTPIDPNNVRMYVCGPTVYDFAHIGNARPVIVFDVLFRLLRHIYGPDHVTYVRNITDVDDKINARAARDYPDLPLNEAIRKVTTETERQFQVDIAALGVLSPTFEPRATEYIRRDDSRNDMVSLIETLVKRGHAYVAADHVLFDVASMPDYGRLSNRSLDEMEAGARVEVAPYKKGPMDFVLWKPSKPGEPAWPSPCGIAVPGRPGWHIECSAMAGALLGDVFDIHGGGIDLTFPHHENEIAQSRCAHGTSVMANVWMHNGFLQVESEKMSKSLGNFVTINELLTGWKGVAWPGEAIRFCMLLTHYRRPIDWTQSSLDEAHQLLWSFYKDVEHATPDNCPDAFVVESLCDDLNTPGVRAALSKLKAEGKLSALAGSLKFLGFSLNFAELRRHFRMHAEPAHSQLSGQEVRLVRSGVFDPLDQSGPEALPEGAWSLMRARLEARKSKDFKESDRIRDELAKMGISLNDTKNKETGEIETEWEVTR